MLFFSGKKHAMAILDSDGEDVFVLRYALYIIFSVIYILTLIQSCP